MKRILAALLSVVLVLSSGTAAFADEFWDAGGSDDAFFQEFDSWEDAGDAWGTEDDWAVEEDWGTAEDWSAEEDWSSEDGEEFEETWETEEDFFGEVQDFEEVLDFDKGADEEFTDSFVEEMADDDFGWIESDEVESGVEDAAKIELAAASSVKISKASATIEVGESIQLKVYVDGKARSADSWSSSKSKVAKVNTGGLVTGVAEGSAVITAKVSGKTVECLVSVIHKTVKTNTRYNVLILDASGSVAGEPLKKEKDAAKRFAARVLAADGDNYVAVIIMKSSASLVISFSRDLTTIKAKIDAAKAAGDTNYYEAFQKADELLSSVPDSDKVTKNVILCSDGLPSCGKTTSSGRYTSKDSTRYKYANAAYNIDVTMKNKAYFIYALGFFYNAKGDELLFGKRLMKDLASENRYYIIQDEEDFDDTWDDIIDGITSYALNKTKLTLKVGETYGLCLLNSGKTVSGVTWKTSNSAIATVSSSGTVKGIKAGTATITATYKGKTYKCTVTVQPKPTLTLGKSSIILYVGQSYKLPHTTNSTKTITWKSSSTAVAKVSSKGTITAVKVGTCNITASVEGLTKTCKVTVKKPSISLNYTSKTISVGDTLQLEATVKGPSKTVTWSTSNSAIAKVSSTGKVTGVKVGTCTITAKANGVTAKCAITVDYKHPNYSFFIQYDKAMNRHGAYTNESGAYLKYNEDGKVTKCAVNVYQKDGYYYFVMACTGTNLTWVELWCYAGLNGKLVFDSSNSSYNHFPMSQDSSGVWSRKGTYGSIYFTDKDSDGNLLVTKGAGTDHGNVALFDDLDEMKEWLMK